MNLITNMALSSVDNRSLLIKRTVRILGLSLASDSITVIEIEPRDSNDRKYFTAPFHLKLSHVEAEIEALVLVAQQSIKARPDVLATDEALNKKYGKSPCYAVTIRNERFSSIEEIAPTSHDYHLFLDGQTRSELIDQYLISQAKPRSDALKRSAQQIIFQFLAEGSNKNSLTPFSAGKGKRGVERQQVKKLGTKNAVTRAGEENLEGFVMTELAKQHCAFAFRNFLLRGKTVQQALDKMWREYYSEVSIGEDGKTFVKLFPRHQRPTKRQFKRWGQKYAQQEVWQKNYNSLQLQRLDRPVLGNQTDEIIYVGQLAGIDSTSTDTEFVSVTNRLKRIGQAHRILLVDSLFGYIPGFYMGINSASHKTVKLACLNAASDKVEWLEALGLSDEISPDDWIPIQFGHFNADNTDARNSMTMDEMVALGVGATFLPVARSDLNAPVETSHKRLHRTVDHKLLGTTQGKPHVRGNEKADHLARLTIIEGIRETVRAVHYHNTRPRVDIELTLEIRRELMDKGLTVNLLNLTRLAINNGRLHSSIRDFDELMCIYGVKVKGTFTAKGVKLHKYEDSRRDFLEPLRYTSKSPAMLKIFHEAKVHREGPYLRFDAEFYYNPYFPSKIYYPDPYTQVIHALDRYTKDEECMEFTIPDYVAASINDALYDHKTEEENDQLRAQLDIGIENTNNSAEAAHKKALAESSPIPKSRITKDKKQNRKQEKSISKYGVPELKTEPAPAPEVKVEFEIIKPPKNKTRNVVHEFLLRINR